jgi:hypothetical protein
MDLQSFISNLLTATLIFLPAGVLLYAVVATTAERAQHWLARQRRPVRQAAARWRAFLETPLPRQPLQASLGLFAAAIESGVESVSRWSWARPAPPSGRERRRHQRFRTGYMGSLHEDAETRASNLCDILDISATGARIRPVDPMQPTEHMTLGLERFGLFPARVVWWRNDEVGLRFEQTPTQVTYMMRGLLPEPRHAH